MSPRLTRALTLIGLLFVLGGVDYEIYDKERVIRGGETIYLELAPVDPRSLMQGDYMALRFRLAEEIERWREDEERERLRTAPLRVDARGVATLATAGGPTEIAFRIRRGAVWLGTNAYFFAEGTADRYAGARYGEFRIDRSSGEAVLVGLRDADLNPL
jgi:uncharacterized membrane-anchored protein